ADYLGAAACAPCHSRQSATQPATSMARTASRASNSDVLRAQNRLTFRGGSYSYQIVTSGPQSLYSVSDGDRSSSAPLTWAFGAGKVGQSFLFERDGAFHEARVSYYDAVQALDVTPGRAQDSPKDVSEAMSRPVSGAEVRRCFGCHTTAAAAGGTFD